jgi:hypothetical protein
MQAQCYLSSKQLQIKTCLDKTSKINFTAQKLDLGGAVELIILLPNQPLQSTKEPGAN